MFSRSSSLVPRSRFLRAKSDSVLTKWSCLVSHVDAEVSERCFFKTHSCSESRRSGTLIAQSVSRSTRRRSKSREWRSLSTGSRFQSTRSGSLSRTRRCDELEGGAACVLVGSVPLRAFYPWGPRARRDPERREQQAVRRHIARGACNSWHSRQRASGAPKSFPRQTRSYCVAVPVAVAVAFPVEVLVPVAVCVVVAVPVDVLVAVSNEHLLGTKHGPSHPPPQGDEQI